VASASASTVHQVVERLLRDGTVTSRAGTSHTVFPVAVNEAEGLALERWIKRERAARTVEVGLGYGVSALFICAGLLANGGEARHVALDPQQATRFENCGLQLLQEAGVARLVEHHAEESQTVLPRFLAEGREFEFAFVDGNHRFDGVFLDLVYLGRLVQPGGILFVDDFQLPAVARAAAFCLHNLGWTLEESSDEDELHGWAVLRTSGVPDTRAFDHFVDF
jgi:predicted O-methyltransferase YrrM